MLGREEGWLEGANRLGKLHRKLPKMDEKPMTGNKPNIQGTKIKTISKTQKSINIKNTTSGMPMDTEKFGKFNTDLFKKDYQEMIRKIFPQYSIEFSLINDENWLAYPDITGDITEDEKNEIIKTMEADPLFDLFTNDKYYTDTPGDKNIS